MSLQPTQGILPAHINPQAIVEYTPDVHYGAVAQGLIGESPKATTRLWLDKRLRHLLFCSLAQNADMLHLQPRGGWRKVEAALFLAEYEQDEAGAWRRIDGADLLTGPKVEAPPPRAAVKVEASKPSAPPQAAAFSAPPVVPPPATPPRVEATSPPGLERATPLAARPASDLDEMFGAPKNGLGDMSGLPTARGANSTSYPAGSVIPASISQADLAAALGARPAGPLREEIGKGLWDAVLSRALAVEGQGKARDTTIAALNARIAKAPKGAA